MFNGGMNAYHKHKEPSEEMKAIWKQKMDLIILILNKFNDIDRADLEFKTPEQLMEILDK